MSFPGALPGFFIQEAMLKIEHRSVASLIPYARNARTHSDDQVAQIAASIREFGWTNPILVDGENGIIAGHGRLMAARKLGMTEVPVIELAHLSDTQKRALILADNKLALNAGWDDEMLALEIVDLKEEGFDLDLIGFSLDEIEELLDSGEEVPGLTDPDAAPEVQEVAITKPGDVWLLGKHRVMCGDSTSIDAVEVLMDGAKPAMVFTDPPYGVAIVNTKTSKVGGDGPLKFGTRWGGGRVDAKKYAPIIGDDSMDAAKEFYETCLSAGFENFIIWGGNYFTDFLSASSCWLVWDKQNTGDFADVELAWTSFPKTAKLYSFLWNGLSREGNRKDELHSRIHPTQKPVGLFENIFADFDFKTCFDGFLGSGSTLIACEKTGRICYGMELSPQYCDVIVRRWQDYTGKTAVLEATGQSFDEVSNGAPK